MAENTKQFRGACCLFVWDIGIDTIPLFSEHEVILLMACQLRTPKFDFALQNESKNLEQFIMLFVPRFASYRLQFISYLGVLRAIFLHFQWLTFFFFLDPARCWLNSCLQPWCWNITENYIIMLKLVNKERQTTSLNHGAQDSMRITKFTTSDAANSYILSPAAQVNWLANDNCFTPQSEFKVSTWPLCGILNSIFFNYKSNSSWNVSHTSASAQNQLWPFSQTFINTLFTPALLLLRHVIKGSIFGKIVIY